MTKNLTWEERFANDSVASKWPSMVIGLCEADQFAQVMLWKENSKSSTTSNESAVPWVEHNDGYFITLKGEHFDTSISVRIAQLQLMPELAWATILFWSCTSLKQDWELAEQWITAQFPYAMERGRRRNSHNAMNFHNVLDGARHILKHGHGADDPEPVTDCGPRCDNNVYENGEHILTFSTMNAARIERWVTLVREASGQSVDWHYFGGRAVVKYVGDFYKVKAAIEALTPKLRELYEEYVKDGSDWLQGGNNHLAKGYGIPDILRNEPPKSAATLREGRDPGLADGHYSVAPGSRVKYGGPGE